MAGMMPTGLGDDALDLAAWQTEHRDAEGRWDYSELRSHVKAMHPRMVRSGLARKNEDLSREHAREHHRYGGSHRHEGSNLGSDERPPGWYTGKGVVQTRQTDLAYNPAEPRDPHTGKWIPLGGGGWEGRDRALQEWFHPQQLEATQVKHPRSGYMVDSGLSRRVTRPPDSQHGNESLGIEGPPTFDVIDHGDPNSPSYNSLKFMNPQPSRTEPIQHVYRGISESEWEQAQQRGYLSSDRRGTISELEGTNAAVDPSSAVSYLPTEGPSRIVKIEVRPEDKWFTIRADEYLRTRQQIPLDRVRAVSPPLRAAGGWHEQLDEPATELACPHCGCPTDGLAIQLGEPAFLHELRIPAGMPHAGEWMSASTQVIPGAGYSKQQLENKLAQMIKRAHGPDRIVALVNAGSALHVDDWLLAGSHLFKAADAADAEMKPGTRSQAAKSYRALAEAIEEHYTQKTALGDRMVAVNRAAAQEAPHWLGGGAEKWDGQDITIFDQASDSSVAASMSWHGDFSMSDDTARVVRDVLDSSAPAEPTPDLAVAPHELIHGVDAPLDSAHLRSGRTARDDEILRLANLAARVEHTSGRTTIASLANINFYRDKTSPEITEAEITGLVQRGFLRRAGKDHRGDQAWLPSWQESQTAPPTADTDSSQHQAAYKRYRVSRAEEGFTELGTNYHMPQWMDSAGIANHPTTTMDVVNPEAFTAKFNKQALYDNQQTLRDLEQEAGQTSGQGTMAGYTALGNAKWALFADPIDTEVIAINLATAAAALRPSYPALSAKIYGFMHTLNVDPADVRNLTMREYAEQIASHPARIASGGWGHYKWETRAAQAWVNGVARYEGLDPDYPGGPGLARAVELSDEVNQQGPAGKFGAMARQIMRAAGERTDIQPWRVDKLAQEIENAWPVDSTEDPAKVVVKALQTIGEWRVAQQ